MGPKVLFMYGLGTGTILEATAEQLGKRRFLLIIIAILKPIQGCAAA
jgi:hypothetical protein